MIFDDTVDPFILLQGKLDIALFKYIIEWHIIPSLETSILSPFLCQIIPFVIR